MNIVRELSRLEREGEYSKIVKLLDDMYPQISPFDKQSQYGHFINRAKACSLAMEYAEAEKSFLKAYELSGDLSMLYGASIPQLHQGKLLEGFTNYGNRWINSEMTPHMNSMCNKGVPYVKSWNDIIGKRLFISGEQGLGDELMFSRVISEASKYTAEIFKLTPKSLVTFFQYNLPNAQMVPEKLSTLPKDFIAENYDCIVSIGDLFRIYVLTFGRLPSVPCYISESTNNISGIGWVNRTGGLGDTVALREVPEYYFKEMSRYYTMVNLQPNMLVPFGISYGNKITSFMDTANIISSLYAIVTIDTSVAHLALNMSKPTLIIYNEYIDWRWKIGMYPRVQLLSIKDENFFKKIDLFIQGATK